MTEDPDLAVLRQMVVRLETENARLRAQNMAAQRMVVEGAQPIGTALVTCLQYWNDLAQGDPPNPQALTNLRNLHEALNISRALVAGIHVPKNGKEHRI